jgi:MoxR-like ATPase
MMLTGSRRPSLTWPTSSGPLTTAQLLPQPTDRAFFVGTTGSGKTTLARQLLEHRAHVAVLDLKRTLKWDGYRTYDRLRDAVRADPRATPKIIYAPRVQEFNDWALLNAFFRWAFERRHTTVYVDVSAVERRRPH